MFYLVDFLLKFHGQAFSWRDLYRLDEYVISHRVPDLDYIYNRIVRLLAKTHLEKISNGLYSYRFKSGLAKELKFISRISRNEMASFNFTLDESRELKQIYLRKLSIPGNQENIDIIVALGELYDFDHEYDMARGQFRTAISLLDDKFEERYGKLAVRDAKFGFNKGAHIIKRDVTWAFERLRLLMQLAMTFERDNKTRSSIAIYHDAQMLAQSILTAFLQRTDTADEHDGPITTYTRIDLLKQYRIIFLPLFCKAWAIEKSRESVQNSLAMLEAAVNRIRSMLPYPSFGFRRDGSQRRFGNRDHANFCLILAQLHDRYGDLAFYKGDRNDLEAKAPWKEYLFTGKKFGKAFGYLHTARGQYAMSLDSLRAFSNREKYLLDASDRGSCADYLEISPYLKQEFAHVLGDMADVLIAMTDFDYLFKEMENLPNSMFTPMLLTAPSSDLDSLPGDILPDSDGPRRFLAGIKTSVSEAEERVRTFLLPRTANQDISSLLNSKIKFRFPWPLRCFRSRDLGTVDDWLGNKNKQRSNGIWSEVMEFPSDNSGAAANLDFFIVSFLTARVATEFRVKTGDFSTASEECHAISSWLLQIIVGRILRNELSVMKDRGNGFLADSEMTENFGEPSSQSWPYIFKEISFLSFLFGCCFEALSRSAEILEHYESVNRPGEARDKVFGHLSSFILYDTLLLQSLLLAYRKLLGVNEDSAQKDPYGIRLIDKCLKHLSEKNLEIAKRILELNKDYERSADAGARRPFELPDSCSGYENFGELVDYLQECLTLFRYPVVARLKGYRNLIYMSLIEGVVSKAEGADGEIDVAGLNELGAYMDELHRLYDAPFHNNPTEHGICLAFLVLFAKKVSHGSKRSDDEATERLSSRVKNYYSQAKQMHTMGDYYYDSISSMYYAYEDFNDRHAHRAHAVQMTLSSLFHELRYLIREIEETEFADDVKRNSSD